MPRPAVSGRFTRVLSNEIMRGRWEQGRVERVGFDLGRRQGTVMPRPHIHDDARVTAFVLGASHTRYLVMRQQDVWFITFNGEEFGPYQSECEAMLFAVDAAHKLGENGEETRSSGWTRTAMRPWSGPTASTCIRPNHSRRRRHNVRFGSILSRPGDDRARVRLYEGACAPTCSISSSRPIGSPCVP